MKIFSILLITVSLVLSPALAGAIPPEIRGNFDALDQYFSNIDDYDQYMREWDQMTPEEQDAVDKIRIDRVNRQIAQFMGQEQEKALPDFQPIVMLSSDRDIYILWEPGGPVLAPNGPTTSGMQWVINIGDFFSPAELPGEPPLSEPVVRTYPYGTPNTAGSLTSVHEEQQFGVEVKFPADKMPRDADGNVVQTIDVSIKLPGGKGEESVSLQYIGGTRYQTSGPISAHGGGDGASWGTLFSLGVENADTVTLMYGGSRTELKVYDSPVLQALGAYEDAFLHMKNEIQTALRNNLTPAELEELNDPDTPPARRQELADRWIPDDAKTVLERQLSYIDHFFVIDEKEKVWEETELERGISKRTMLEIAENYAGIIRNPVSPYGDDLYYSDRPGGSSNFGFNWATVRESTAYGDGLKAGKEARVEAWTHFGTNLAVGFFEWTLEFSVTDEVITLAGYDPRAAVGPEGTMKKSTGWQKFEAGVGLYTEALSTGGEIYAKRNIFSKTRTTGPRLEEMPGGNWPQRGVTGGRGRPTTLAMGQAGDELGGAGMGSGPSPRTGRGSTQVLPGSELPGGKSGRVQREPGTSGGSETGSADDSQMITRDLDIQESQKMDVGELSDADLEDIQGEAPDYNEPFGDYVERLTNEEIQDAITRMKEQSKRGETIDPVLKAALEIEHRRRIRQDLQEMTNKEIADSLQEMHEKAERGETIDTVLRDAMERERGRRIQKIREEDAAQESKAAQSGGGIGWGNMPAAEPGQEQIPGTNTFPVGRQERPVAGSEVTESPTIIGPRPNREPTPKTDMYPGGRPDTGTGTGQEQIPGTNSFPVGRPGRPTAESDFTETPTFIGPRPGSQPVDYRTLVDPNITIFDPAGTIFLPPGKILHVKKTTGMEPSAVIPTDLLSSINQSYSIGNTQIFVVTFPLLPPADLQEKIDRVPDLTAVEDNSGRLKQEQANDPYYLSSGAWGQDYDDQWAIKRVGFTRDKDSAWKYLHEQMEPVVVAVIDTGLAWNHPDFSLDNLWINDDEIPNNGIDDDHNGYIDDIVGWDFIGHHNVPWDFDGHGTFVTGLIAAQRNNFIGIVGINPLVKIMVLKAMTNFGQSRASFLAEAIVYAADNGARVINLSVGGRTLTKTEQLAIDYAHEKGAVIVAAAGNEGIDVRDFGPAGMDHIITVSSTDTRDKRAGFSNWGHRIDIAAPGIDVLSLRAMRTDLTVGTAGQDRNSAAENFVGRKQQYYRASGTSFSSPIVAATASLILARNPTLTTDQVTRMLLYSARDIEEPGRDRLSGHGLLDARAALAADPDYYTIAEIKRVAPIRKRGKTVIQVSGTAASSEFQKAWMLLGFGEQPEGWKKVGQPITKEVRDNVLAEIGTREFKKKGKWILRLVVQTRNHGEKEGRETLNLK